MILASLDTVFIIVGIISGAVAVGTAVFSVASKAQRIRVSRNEREEKQKEDELQLKQSIVGVPATPYSPRIPGVIENLKTLTILVDKLEARVDDHIGTGTKAHHHESSATGEGEVSQ